MKAKLSKQLLLSGLLALACGNTTAVMAADVSAKDLSEAISKSFNAPLINSPLINANNDQISDRGGRRPPGGGNGGGNRPPGGGNDDGNPPPGGGNGGGNAPPGGGGNGGGNPPPGGNGGGNPPPGGGGGGGNPPPQGDVNAQLRNIIDQRDLNVDPTANRNLPDINDIMAQLGKSLFFAKNLGGQNDASCASCHHPTLGGGDNLSLPVGVDAVNSNDVASPDLLGHGRFHDNNNGNRPVIGRNSPTVFNIGLIDRGLFWDSRVEAINPTPGSNGTADAIVTPDSIVNANGRRQPDQNLPQGTSLPAAQARFPVTSNNEMRGQFAAGDDNQSLRAQLSARFDNSDSDYNTGWPVLFNQAYPDGEINFNRIADAIGEYERSMTFINNPWTAYLRGDDTAMTDQQKSGAVLFFTPRNRGGGGCAGCHNGPTFSDGRHHLTAFPQIGPGAGDDSGAGVNDDFG
ncbi:MAG: hypothetical protein HRT35_16000, partial [Algicola sp.]|nr:hypothetical protein [Algicola sp.]